MGYLYRFILTKWHSYCDHRLYDVTSRYVYGFPCSVVSASRSMKLCVCLCSEVKMITSHVLRADSRHILLGSDAGSIHTFDMETFALTDKVIAQDIVLQK